ncbi:MAG: hypothetical protein JO253_05990 [Alphaproteobacteria bacterium]|nr:hypothetical protein [Alphaproteobacteria bacterium]
MNIEDLTIKQARELAALFGATQSSGESLGSHMVGKYVIARCYSAGVHAGEVVKAHNDEVILKNARRLWQWQAKDGVALSGLAQHGLKGGKVDTIVPEIYLTGVCELIPCSAAAKDSIHGA